MHWYVASCVNFCCFVPAHSMMQMHIVLGLPQPSVHQPSNAICAVTLSAYMPKKKSRRCTFQRAKSIENPPLFTRFHLSRGPAPPERPPSRLPPPGTLRASIVLGNCLGHGRSCVVFEATVDLSHSSPELRSLAFPPLVAKISRAGMAEDLQHEAFYFDEMECIQGVVVPRYYGTFKGKLPRGSSFLRPAGRSMERRLLATPPYDFAHKGYINTSETDVPLPVFDFSSVTISVMERLGDHLPLGKPLPKELEYVILSSCDETSAN